MTEQELRDKIVNIAISTVWKDCYGDEVVIDRAVAEQFADALIAAGLTFDGEYKKLYEEEKTISQSLRGTSWQFKDWYKEQKHRAEVAEKAFELYLKDNPECEECVDRMNGVCSADIEEKVDCANSAFRLYKGYAEKELAEGKKNE